jgi:hypothetical protein
MEEAPAVNSYERGPVDTTLDPQTLNLIPGIPAAERGDRDGGGPRRGRPRADPAAAPAPAGAGPALRQRAVSTVVLQIHLRSKCCTGEVASFKGFSNDLLGANTSFQGFPNGVPNGYGSVL